MNKDKLLKIVYEAAHQLKIKYPKYNLILEDCENNDLWKVNLRILFKEKQKKLIYLIHIGEADFINYDSVTLCEKNKNHYKSLYQYTTQ